MIDNNNSKEQVNVSPEMEQACYAEIICDALYCNKTADGHVDAKRLKEFIEGRFEKDFMDGVDGFCEFIGSIDGLTMEEGKRLAPPLARNIYNRRLQCFPNFAELELLLRKNMIKNNKFTPLSPDFSFSYEVDGTDIFVHLGPSYSIANKITDFRGALSTLAKELKRDDLNHVKNVHFYSHLVETRPGIVKLLGFTKDPDPKKPTHAFISTADFIQNDKPEDKKA